MVAMIRCQFNFKGRAVITIELNIMGSKDKQSVKGYATASEFLGVHKDMTGDTWAVTHLLSSFRVKGRLERKKDAMHLANEIKDKLDWSKSAEEVLEEFKKEKPLI